MLPFSSLSEEDADIRWDVRSDWTRYWLVDPLDGTNKFIKRNGEFTVNIVLIEQGVPAMGVVYAPAIETIYVRRCATTSMTACSTPISSSVPSRPLPGHESGARQGVGKRHGTDARRCQSRVKDTMFSSQRVSCVSVCGEDKDN
ncbi:3'(2'),5'-bisphosphate nucleotidase CysQ family protein [Cobetia amphilecti]|uniref:3'(2'),5'-bisphosphate nucleotidase CysQ family protein n=1 Tax=Cobetia amphilecti TaxID=1055104 RepID=UPI0039083885